MELLSANELIKSRLDNETERKTANFFYFQCLDFDFWQNKNDFGIPTKLI